MKNLKNLILETKWKNIEPIILKLYPEYKNDIEGFEMVYLQLKEIQPEESDYIINIEFTTPRFEGDEPYWDVSSIDKNDNKKYALDFVKWEIWLGSEIAKDVLNKFTNEEIISHCLFEMTFDGFSQNQIQEKKNELIKRIEEIKNGTTELITLNDLKNN